MLLDKNIMAFIIQIALFILKMTIYLASKPKIVSLFIQKMNVLIEDANFANIFKNKFAKMLPKWTSMNKYSVKRVNCKQLFIV